METMAINDTKVEAVETVEIEDVGSELEKLELAGAKWMRTAPNRVPRTKSRRRRRLERALNREHRWMFPKGACGERHPAFWSYQRMDGLVATPTALVAEWYGRKARVNTGPKPGNRSPSYTAWYLKYQAAYLRVRRLAWQSAHRYDLPVGGRTPIDGLEFSVRTRNCMEIGNIKTLGQLEDASIDELMQIKNFSQKCLTEIREKLAQYGLKLRYDRE